MRPKISPAVESHTAAWYAKNYREIEDDIGPVFEKLDTPFLDERLKPGMKVFDGLMGQGRHALRYAKRGCIVHGNDLNPHMVAFATAEAKRLRIPEKNLKLTVGDATRLKGVPSDRFDAALAMFSAIGTIPGSANRQKAMDELSRVTKPGGIVIVHAHNRWDTFFSHEFLPWTIRTYTIPVGTLEKGDIIADYNGLEGMFNHFYSPRELRRSMRKAGLEVVEEAYLAYHPPAFLKGVFRKVRADGFLFVGRKAYERKRRARRA